MERKAEESLKDLDYSSADCQLLIHKYTGLIYEFTQRYDIVVAENEVLRQQLELRELGQSNLMNDTVQNAAPLKLSSLCPECINMQLSLSWRITKLLRIVKKTLLTLKLYEFISILNKGSKKS
ncbi:hypothetical protein [Flavobacterium sp. UBA6046]|uniref:hypothetical protein n=1 Tax=Flavobacterium sp. UBA6046 TaxID=1946552 RepID=UPI0025BDC4D1|nr:hypothetical protein [Flavobacterium sp. UBA6046]